VSSSRTLLPFTSSGAPGSPGAELTFAVLGDAQPVLPYMPLSQITGQIARELALLRPAFVLYTGDRIWGYRHTRQELLNEYDRFRALADSTGVPFYGAPGNHEMQSDPVAARVLEERGQLLYGSFDVGPYHFVGLNTDEVEREGRVCGAQLRWLRADLERHRDAAGVFVFMHRPLFSWFQGDFNPDDAERLQELFRRYPVRAVFAGHDHLYYEEERDGVRYVTAGGGGGTVYAQPPAGGYAHYLLVSARPDGVDVEVIEPYHLEVVYTAGNDGFEPVAAARVVNTTERRLLARNLEFHVPRLSSPEHYRLSTRAEEFDGKPLQLDVIVRRVADLGDGSVRLGVEVPLPDGMGFYVTVEAREP
jgi:3',5'-cyclic AMP phosphodiesterase CpdA